MTARRDFIYLDNNATTAIDPAVLEAMRPYLENCYANPSSGYAFATEARDAVEQARTQVAALLGCTPAEIVFTSCGTESINTAYHSALETAPGRKHIVTTTVEHSAVLRPAQELQKRGYEVTFVGVDENGRVDLDEIAKAIRADTALVAVMWANNETGVLFPIKEIAAMAREKAVPFLTDAVQAAGKVPIQLQETPLQFLAISGHKLHAPKGVGALYVNRRARFRPMILGGSHEENRRAGTSNVASIVALGKAAEIALREVQDEQTRIRAWRDRFEQMLSDRIPGTRIHGAEAERLPNTSSLRFAGVESDAALVMFDRDGLCCSGGSACKTGSLQPSHVMTAMGISAEDARGAMRFSFGRFNSDEDLKRALEIIPRVITKLRSLSPTLARA